MNNHTQQVINAFQNAMEMSFTISDIVQLTNSYGHQCWRIQTKPGDTYLLKIKMRKPDLTSFENEIAAHRLALKYSLPIPPLVAVCPTPNLLGRHYYIQQWLPGGSGDVIVPNLSPAKQFACMNQFGLAVATMHQIKGRYFSEDVLGDKVYSDWQILCENRLARLTQSNREARVLPPDMLFEAIQRCQAFIVDLPSDMLPSFTHRDLYLANILIHEEQFQTLIDFEAVRFYDPLWDFAKLSAWVFRPYPTLRDPFIRGYTSLVQWEADFAQRIYLYQGLEYLAAFPYFGMYKPNLSMVKDFQSLLEDWLASDPGIILTWKIGPSV